MLRMFDFRCPKGHIFEAMTDCPASEPIVECPECGYFAFVVWLRFPGTTRGGSAQRFDPVVVFKKPDGSYAFPGRSNDPTPAGMERVELTSAQAVRRFESQENARIKTANESRLEREDRGYQAVKKAKRDRLRAQVEGRAPLAIPGRDGRPEQRPFTGPGRKFAEYAIQRSEERPSLSRQAQQFNPNFRVDALSFDASNRAPFNDVDVGLSDKK